MLNPQDIEYTKNLEELKKCLEELYSTTHPQHSRWKNAWIFFFKKILGNITNEQFDKVHHELWVELDLEMTKPELLMLMKAMSKNHSITRFSMNGKTTDSILEFGMLLRNNSTITELSLISIVQRVLPLPLSEWQTFADGLAQNKTIRKLNLGNNGINDEILQILANGLASHPTLTEFSLEWSLLTEKSIDILADLLKKNPILTKIDLKGSIRNSMVLSKISQFIASNPSLQALDISNLEFVPIDDGKELCEALQQNTQLKELNLSCSELLASRSTFDLEELYSGDDEPEQEPILKKPARLSQDKQTTLNFLLDALKTQRSIKVLDLTAMPFNEYEIWQIADILRENRVLNTLIIDHCWRHGPDPENRRFMKIICEALKTNRTLSELHVPCINGAEDYIDSLMDMNRSLHTINGTQDRQEKYVQLWPGIQQRLNANKPAAKAAERVQVSEGLSSAAFSVYLMKLIYDFIGCNEEPKFDRESVQALEYVADSALTTTLKPAPTLMLSQASQRISQIAQRLDQISLALNAGTTDEAHDEQNEKNKQNKTKENQRAP